MVIASDYRVPDPAPVWQLLERNKSALADIGAHHVLVYTSTHDYGRVLVMIGVSASRRASSVSGRVPGNTVRTPVCRTSGVAVAAVAATNAGSKRTRSPSSATHGGRPSWTLPSSSPGLMFTALLSSNTIRLHGIPRPATSTHGQWRSPEGGGGL
jgi:hypothetical protein